MTPGSRKHQGEGGRRLNVGRRKLFKLRRVGSASNEAQGSAQGKKQQQRETRKKRKPSF
jgi:hypothetical protein